MKKGRLAAMVMGLMLMQATQAQNVKISAIPSPEFTEVESLKTGAFRPVAELGKLKFPLSAQTEKSDGTLVFRADGERYRIGRADVTLQNETLVVDACNTVPVILALDSRSATVKGAGEGCR
ncbi:hypothetical protein NA643_01435 [Pseudomonas stutzeri]|uniref:hypothetical protein n=1 Tax=Stutzerimonas stutzeri TaxID=316 RepID=UPI0011AEDC9D|nr:hypothetical protein [Stutzerimonas stutzeri]MCQ4277739.1 hypothetical protein [Stutzerimonas stutzeri]